MFFDDLAKYQDNRALVSDSGEVLTYQELAQKADLICKDMESRQIVFLLCRNEVEAMCGYMGFLRKRVVPVMVDAEIESGLLNSLMEKYRPAYVYCPVEKTEQFTCLSKLYSGDRYELIQIDNDVVKLKNEELGLLLTTSGSTGSPKLVRQTYKNIQANAESIVTYLELTEDEKPIVTLPMNYTYGLSIIHSHLQAGATILVTKNPVNNKFFWEFFQNEGATSFGGVPFTYEMLKRIRFMRMDLPTLRTMTQAGGKLSPVLHEEFATWAMEHGKKFVVMYGQTEATARMAYLPPEKSLEKIGSMGVPIPGGTLQLLDANNEVITQAEVAGELVYSGANVTMGYAECREDLDKEDAFKGVLHTGDMAKRDKDGFYYIVGRMKRFLKLFGSRINLDEVDMLIKQKFTSFECATTGTDDKMITFVTQEDAVEEVKKYILETTHVNSSAVEVRYCKEIPKNNAGKILYTELEKM